MTLGSPAWTNPLRRFRKWLPRKNLSALGVAANSLWWMSLLNDALAFQSAQRDVAGTQRRLFTQLIQRNADTEFGRQWNFDAIRSIDDYRDNVPLSDYEDYQPYIHRILKGAQRVLTSDPVVILEPTGGSTGATKLIPYTESLRREFRRAIAPWVVGAFTQWPRLALGQAYWAVSPVARPSHPVQSGIPIGFEDDSEYLGYVGRRLIRAALAVPSTVRNIQDIDSFRYVTLLFLLRSRNLSLISVWHPTFLTLMFKPLAQWRDQLANDIAAGQITPPGTISADVLAQLRATVRPEPDRADQVRDLIDSGSYNGEASSMLWPYLRLISCWADGNAQTHVPTVAWLFPKAVIQPKGLVATEGIVSLPMGARPGCTLAVRSHFFEFLPAGAQPSEGTVLAHQLEADKRYSVVITTGGGLYRYRTHDLVEVVGHVRSCPLIRFTGKESHISDHFGEKLNDRHVKQVLDSTLARHKISSEFAMLAFDEGMGYPAYALFVESDTASDGSLLSLGAETEAALRENYHYRYCRDLGQLGALVVFRIDANAGDTYAKVCYANGQRIGDLKPPSLHRITGWSRLFCGRFL